MQGIEAMNIVDMASSLGSVGVIAWLALHLVSKTIPKMQDTFEKRLDAQNAVFMQAVKDQELAHEKQLDKIVAMVEGRRNAS